MKLDAAAQMAVRSTVQAQMPIFVQEQGLSKAAAQIATLEHIEAKFGAQGVAAAEYARLEVFGDKYLASKEVSEVKPSSSCSVVGYVAAAVVLAAIGTLYANM